MASRMAMYVGSFPAISGWSEVWKDMNTSYTVADSVQPGGVAGDDLFRWLHLFLASLAPRKKASPDDLGSVTGKSESTPVCGISAVQLEAVKGGQR